MVRSIPETINNRIKQVTIQLRDESGSLRNPTSLEVHAFLREEYSQRGVPEYLPGERHVRKIVSMVKMKPISDIDSPWSLGKSDDHRIPDAATGAILEVWRWATINNSGEPISIRIARWVSKLRWVPNAGGSPQGEVKDPEKLYHAVVMYAGRERIVELIKDKTDKEGMRSGVLDAHLMLEPWRQKLARSLGILEDDTGINYGADLSTVAPRYQATLNAKYFIDRGERPEHDRSKNVIGLLLGKFGDSKQDVTDMLTMVMSVLATELKRGGRVLSDVQADHYIKEFLEEMLAVHKVGDVRDWNPERKMKTILYERSLRDASITG